MSYLASVSRGMESIMKFRWQLATFIVALVLMAVILWNTVIGLALIVVLAIGAIHVAIRRTSRS